jgi:hypothetical protein
MTRQPCDRATDDANPTQPTRVIDATNGETMAHNGRMMPMQRRNQRVSLD